MKPYKGEIHHWKKTQSTPIQDVESLGYHIVGLPSGHPEFVGWIITSPVVKFDENTGDFETLNSLYKAVGPCLGTITGKISKSDFVIPNA